MKKYIPLLAIVMLLPSVVYGKSFSHSGLDWFMIISTFLGGLAMFLYGLEQMSDGLKRSAGDKMRHILAVLSKNRIVALFVGTFVTMIIQSSSATTVMLVSFVNSQLMAFARTLPIILGANIGTTITAQIIAFKVTDYAILMVAAGFFIRFTAKRDIIKNLGDTILGFGLLFYGMHLMSGAMKPLRTYEPFINGLAHLDNPVWAIIIGAAFTALIQSSSAFTGIVILLAQQGLINLTAGVGLILGANIGTCITAGLASIGASRPAKRVALAHVTFKTLGVLLYVFWIDGFVELIEKTSVYLSADPGREIANAHTFFNVTTAFLFLPFTGLFAKLFEKILPDKQVSEDDELKPFIHHLDEKVLDSPSMALELARAEICNTVKLTGKMLQVVIIPFVENRLGPDPKYPNLNIIEGIGVREKKIDYLESAITRYLVKITKNPLTHKESEEIYALISVVNYLETIGDVIHGDIVPLIYKKQMIAEDFSPEGKEELQTYHLKLVKQMARLAEYFQTRDPKKAHRIIEKWEKYTKLDSEYRMKHFERLSSNPESVATHKIHMELMDHFQQIGFHIDAIAKSILKVEIQAAK